MPRPYVLSTMAFDPDIHHRRSVRLAWHDYADAGWYFVTICAARRGDIFGRIENGTAQLHPYGNIIEECWCALPKHFPRATLDSYIVMPDHLHGIIVLTHDATTVGARHASPKNVSPKNAKLGTIVGSFKSAVTRRINERRGQSTKVWQRNYWEHLIRDERDLDNHRRYILENPVRWQTKRDFLA